MVFFLFRMFVMCIRFYIKYYYDLSISIKKIGVEIWVFIFMKYNNNFWYFDYLLLMLVDLM